ncbi:MAG: PH domain-containing protein [Chitinophagaceae bacterium]|nr:PH domain-containing protein [Chitinophagaceae bacterium]
MIVTKKYNSKTGAATLVPLLVLVGGTAALMFIQQIWIGFIFVAIAVSFIASVFLKTYYQLTDNNLLIVTCGFFYKITIPIMNIETIRPTRNPISSPALSLDRLELRYENGNRVLLSPANRPDFIASLQQVNASIKILDK